jgi:hypothetical protein
MRPMLPKKRRPTLADQAFGLTHSNAGHKGNSMKAFKILAFVSLCFTISATLAQSRCGVFATQEDFLNNRVTYAADDCQLNRKFNKDIVAIHRGEKIRFDFRFIYGYSDGQNLYRAYGVKNLWTDHGYYKIVYDKDLVIYKRTLTDYRANTQTYYYFSLSKDSPILPLRKRFYSETPEVGKSIKVYFSALKESVNIPNSHHAPEYLVITDAEIVQKKKPDISARLQTTTRRPKNL